MVNMVQVSSGQNQDPADPQAELVRALQTQGLQGGAGVQAGAPGVNNLISALAKHYFASSAPSAAAAAAGTSDMAPVIASNLADTTAAMGPLPASTFGAAGSDAAAGAGGGSAAGSGLGITPEAGGAIGAAAVPAAIAYAGLSTAPYRLSADWWKQMNTSLTQGTSGNSTYDQNTSPAQQEYNAKQSLYRMLQSQGGDTAVIGGASGNNIPQAFKDMAKSYGMLNADGSVNAKWSGGQDPFALSAAIQARQGVKGGKPL